MLPTGDAPAGGPRSWAKSARKGSNPFAYVFYITGGSASAFECALLIQVHALWATEPRRDIDTVVLHTGDIRPAVRAKLRLATFMRVPEPLTRGQYEWHDSYVKLYAASLTQVK